MNHGYQGREEGPKFTMAKSLTGRLATLGARSRAESAPTDASIDALSENVNLLGSQSWFWGDILILVT